jgi:hypothetical protein
MSDFLLGVVDVDVIVESLLHDDVHVLVDGTIENASSVLDVVIGEIGAASDEADAERGLGDDHDSTLGRHSSIAWL